MRVLRDTDPEPDRGSRLIWRVPRWSWSNNQLAHVYGFQLLGRLGLGVDRFGFLLNVGQWHLYVERGQEAVVYRGRPPRSFGESFSRSSSWL